MRLLITGGCGFIGSNFVRFVLEHYQPEFVTNADVLSYAGNPENLAGVAEEHADRYEFFRSDIADRDAIEQILARHKFYAIVNFAAESHVDRSITDPANFIHTNVIGTEVLLEAARKHGVKRFIHGRGGERGALRANAAVEKCEEENPEGNVAVHRAES